MPKNNKKKLVIRLNLLRPQNNPDKLPVKLIRWLLFSGKYIFVFVEAIVLIAFGARFKLDADIAAKKEAIEEQIPYIESLKAYELLIRQTQLKLSTIDSIRTDSQDFAAIFQKITDIMPAKIKISAINLVKNTNNTTVHLTGQTESNNDLTNFISGLKEENTFSNVSLINVGLEEGVIKFSIDLVTKVVNLGGQKP